MGERGDFFIEQEMIHENGMRELESTKQRLKYLERENKELRDKLETKQRNQPRKTARAISVFLLVASFFVFSTNLTGYFISSESSISVNLFSLILFGLGILGIYISKKI